MHIAHTRKHTCNNISAFIFRFDAYLSAVFLLLLTECKRESSLLRLCLNGKLSYLLLLYSCARHHTHTHTFMDEYEIKCVFLQEPHAKLRRLQKQLCRSSMGSLHFCVQFPQVAIFVSSPRMNECKLCSIRWR